LCIIIHIEIKKNILKTLCGSALVVLATFFTSCTDAKKEVAKFAADFATKVSDNQKDSLLAVWPDVVKADSLALAFSPDASLWRRQIEKDSSKCLLAREQIL